jgi:hypothetical protein
MAKHAAVRRAAEALESCDEFQSICFVLRDTLQPVGFDGIRFQMFHPNGFLTTFFLPLKYKPDGNRTPERKRRQQISIPQDRGWFVSAPLFLQARGIG